MMFLQGTELLRSVHEEKKKKKKKKKRLGIRVSHQDERARMKGRKSMAHYNIRESPSETWKHQEA